MIDSIIANKPNSIFDVVPRELFVADFDTAYLDSGNYWEWNYAIAKTIQPKTYLEVGVRFSYSFIPTLLGSESLEYALGYDLETYGNISHAKDNIEKYYKGSCKCELQHVDSQQIAELPQFFDLINIDGEHTVIGKMHDLHLTIDHCKYVIVDDYDYLRDVRVAVDWFLKEYGGNGWGRQSIIEWATYIPTFRGSMMIKYHV